ncbi:MAG TPA: hypothetical protein VK785_06255 [Opitutaceae bacterium]|nr:hypothetical protein [Opitutaceae bacterium]
MSKKTVTPATHTAPDSRSPQEARLRIDELEDWLKSTLHSKLRNYLQEASSDYLYSAEVISAINGWERQLNPYSDCLLAFASELKSAARTLGGSREKLYASFNSRSGAMAGLRLSAEGLDRASLQLNAAAVNLSQVVARTIYEKVRVPVPPFAGVLQWMHRLELLTNVEALFKMQIKETEVRPLLANKLLPLHSRATTARETVTEIQREYLESYWNELRDHALTHYVKDRKVDKMLDELSGRHAAAMPPPGQQMIQDEAVLLSA